MDVDQIDHGFPCFNKRELGVGSWELGVGSWELGVGQSVVTTKATSPYRLLRCQYNVATSHGTVTLAAVVVAEAKLKISPATLPVIVVLATATPVKVPIADV